MAENGEKRQRAFLNFQKQEDVKKVMKDLLLYNQEEEMRISRYIPKSCPLSGHMTPNILLTIHGRGITEFDMKKYFEKDFGPIIAGDWQSDKEVILQFQQ